LPILLSLLAIPGCSTFHLSNQTGILPIHKQRPATESILAVCQFTYEPQESNDTGLEFFDMQQWQHIVVMGLNQANIFADVVACTGDEIPVAASYVLDGKITRFRFQKNWFPTFFPIHLGLSFFTFTGYTLFGGPTAMTIVRFAVDFELRRAGSDEIILSLSKNYRSTRAVNVYTKGVENPYDNPNMVFAEILGSTAISIAAALPEDHEALAATTALPPAGTPTQPAPVAQWEHLPQATGESPPAPSSEPPPGI
jgi:hypothetical protein